jgi:probable poly-beta-1,6-N-acetyl-D-glucosamine export protein
MSEFLSYIHRLRGFAILFVVGVHARGGASDWISHERTHQFFTTLFDAHEGNGTVMFLFIGGFLFQHLNRNGFDYRRYLWNKFKVIILPYILVSVPIIVYRISSSYSDGGLPADFDTYPYAYQFIYYLVVGNHMAPFWFISAIILFYLAAPLFHYLDKPLFYKTVFPLLIILAMFTYRPLGNANPFLAFVHFAPVYMAGMFVSRYKGHLMNADLKLIVGLGVLYIVLCINEFVGVPHHKLSFEEVIDQRMLIFNVYYLRALLLCFVLTLILYRLSSVRMPVFELLGDYSFGIFFVHFILLTASRKVLDILHVPVDFSVLSFIAFYSFIVVASTFSVFLIKKLTGSYSRNLIGS